MYSWASKYLKSMCAVVAVRQQSLAGSELLWKWENTNKARCRVSNMWSETTQSQRNRRNINCTGHSRSLQSVKFLRVPYPTVTTGPGALAFRCHPTFSCRAPCLLEFASANSRPSGRLFAGLSSQ